MPPETRRHGRRFPGETIRTVTAPYASFAELAREMREGVDFEIRLLPGPLPAIVLAPHAGRIEPGTGRIARAVAGSEFSRYEFRGIRDSDNRRLHLAAHRFDEPRCLAAVRRADLAISIHGAKGDEEFVMVGGRARGWAARIEKTLEARGFEIRAPVDGLRGTHPRNICNRCRGGRGVQLEIAAGLRRRLVAEPASLERFGGAIRSTLPESLREAER